MHLTIVITNTDHITQFDEAIALLKYERKSALVRAKAKLDARQLDLIGPANNEVSSKVDKAVELAKVFKLPSAVKAETEAPAPTLPTASEAVSDVPVSNPPFKAKSQGEWKYEPTGPEQRKARSGAFNYVLPIFTAENVTDPATWVELFTQAARGFP